MDTSIKSALGDATPREKVGSEFWTPKAIGEAVVGRIADFQRRNFGQKERQSFALTPVIVYEKDAEPAGYVDIRVGLNSWLEKLIRPATDAGKFVGIVYLGTVPTPAGDMRKFQVRDVSESKFTALLEAVSPGLGVQRLPAEPSEAVAAIEEDDLPF